jgi:hypothetical protein
LVNLDLGKSDMIDAKPTSGTGMMAAWGRRLIDMIRSQKLLPGPGYLLKQHGTSGVQLQVLFPGMAIPAASGWNWQGQWVKGTIYAVNDVVYIQVQYTWAVWDSIQVAARFLYLCTAPPSSVYPPADPNDPSSFRISPPYAQGRPGWEPIACYHERMGEGISARIQSADGNTFLFYGGILVGFFPTGSDPSGAKIGPGPDQWDYNTGEVHYGA